MTASVRPLRVVPIVTSGPAPLYAAPPTQEQREASRVLLAAAGALESAYRSGFLSTVISDRLDVDLGRAEEAIRRLRKARRS